MRLAWALLFVLAIGAASSFVAAAYLVAGMPAALAVAGALQTGGAVVLLRGLINGG